MKRTLLIAVMIFSLVAVFAYLFLRPANQQIQAELSARPEPGRTDNNPEDFERASQEYSVSFPHDFGAHPEFQTEWWYYTGNLDSEDGEHFGYQLTFFRRTLIPPSEWQSRRSEWATDQVYLAHFAITDVKSNKHQAFERYARGSAGLAGAQSTPYQVWLEDWSVIQIAQNQYRLQASQTEWSVDLILEDIKGPILQGNLGYSQKGPQVGNASIYISQTRLITRGIIGTEAGSYKVAGTSWMDHEFSTSALSDDQVGWDWFALQLDDGSELMLFTIRKADGSIDPFSSGAVIYQDGSSRTLSVNEFQINVQESWLSPETGANYPARWMINVPSEQLTLDVQPYISDQELNLGYEYWEGAVKFQGNRWGESIEGNGYVELTGYAGSFAGEF